MTVALIIIDLQVGNFVGSPPIFQGDLLLENAKKILNKARKMGHKVIYIQNMGEKGDPDESGSEGWEIHPKVRPNHKEPVLQKTTPDSFHQTNLDELLKSMNVKKVIVIGLQTEYCIDTTVRRAYSLGYDVTLVKDCHSTWHSKHFSAKQIIKHHNTVLGSYFADLMGTDELLNTLSNI
ncbi:MAG: cysteine hydrolase family protein [Promethearchaeota archaeon]